jgi:hypothetical protein
MFKRRVENSGKSTVFQYAFKIFFLHILNVPIMLVLTVLMINLDSIGIQVSDMSISAVVTLVCFLFYILFLYIESWRTGERDHNLVMYNRIKYNKYKALSAALISQIPGILLSIVLLVPIFGAEAASDATRYARYFYLNFNYPIILLDDIHNFKLVYLIPVVFAVVPAVFGYFLGYRGKRILDRIMFLKPGDQRRNLR